MQSWQCNTVMTCGQIVCWKEFLSELQFEWVQSPEIRKIYFQATPP